MRSLAWASARAGASSASEGEAAGGHLRPSKALMSAAARPPMRACGRGPTLIARTKTISPARGASGTRTSMASKWLRT